MPTIFIIALTFVVVIMILIIKNDYEKDEKYLKKSKNAFKNLDNIPPVKTLDEYLEFIRKNPVKLSMADTNTVITYQMIRILEKQINELKK